MSEDNFFTEEEVSKHNTRDDCWIILGNDVLDITKFISEHPGGLRLFIKFSNRPPLYLSDLS